MTIIGIIGFAVLLCVAPAIIPPQNFSSNKTMLDKMTSAQRRGVEDRLKELSQFNTTDMKEDFQKALKKFCNRK